VFTLSDIGNMVDLSYETINLKVIMIINIIVIVNLLFSVHMLLISCFLKVCTYFNKTVKLSINLEYLVSG
jgi:hypothetical protein